MPDSNQELLQRGAELHSRGEDAKAAEICQQILQDSFNWEAARLLGNIFVGKGETENGFTWLRQALDANPGSAGLWHELGQIFLKAGQLRDAQFYFRKAVDIQSFFPEAFCDLGAVCVEICCFEEAQLCLKTALKQDPNLVCAERKLREIETSLKQAANLARDWTDARAGDGSHGGLLPLSMEKRELFPYVLNHLGLLEVGLEVGVREGMFSEHLLSFWKGRLLYSVDPWRNFPGPVYKDIANVTQNQHDRLYMDTIRRLELFGDRSVIWRLTSKEAEGLVSDSSLDFCYIDGDHSYQGVVQDLNLWYPKIKSGGVLAGHDFIPDGDYDFGSFGVRRAVNEFVGHLDGKLVISNEPNDKFPSWFIMKK